MRRKSVMERITINHFPDKKKFKDKRRIMIATDGSDCSEKAMDFAIQNILREGDAVFLVMAIKKKNDDRNKKMDKKILEMQSFLVKFSDYPNHGFIFEGKDSRETLLDATAKINPELMVCGSRGRNKIKRMLLGSVSSFLVHNVDCASVIVK